jgi:hypothetical protein
MMRDAPRIGQTKWALDSCKPLLGGRRVERKREMVGGELQALTFVEAMRVLALDSCVELKADAGELFCTPSEPEKKFGAVAP